MASTSSQIPSAIRTKTFVERWYFTGTAIVMLIVSVVGWLAS